MEEEIAETASAELRKILEKCTEQLVKAESSNTKKTETFGPETNDITAPIVDEAATVFRTKKVKIFLARQGEFCYTCPTKNNSENFYLLWLILTFFKLSVYPKKLSDKYKLTRGDNMTDSEKLNLILAEMQDMKTDIHGLKSDMQDMKSDMQDMKSDITELKRRTTNIELHLENHTDRNVQLIAENFIELTNKLNQAIPAADKSLAYEVTVNYLVKEVDELKKNVAVIMDKTA